MTLPLLEALPFLEGPDMIETPFPIRAREMRDDLSLCFLCMRWSAGDKDCRAGKRCDYQMMLDELDRTAKS
jgi:hypothetical protein